MRKNRSPTQLSLGRAFDPELKRRLFFGIWPDRGAADRLTRSIELLRNDGSMPGRPVDADRLHITLLHLGGFDDQIPSGLMPSACAAAATIKTPPFEVAFDRIVGTSERLLLLASDGPAALRDFRQILSAALIKAGRRGHVRSTFNPHVTLSYDLSDVSERRIEPIIWTVRHFVLIESLLGKHRHLERGSWSIEE